MSKELKEYLLSKGISSSRTTPYHPMSNGQCEKTNSTIWKGVTLALKARNLPQSCWQEVLPEVLHSIRSLLCVPINETPHERLFKFQRRSTSGYTLPTWLSEAEFALLRRHVRNSKQDPLVDEVKILEVNPTYAHVKFPDGRETTVSISDLAPQGTKTLAQPPAVVSVPSQPEFLPQDEINETSHSGDVDITITSPTPCSGDVFNEAFCDPEVSRLENGSPQRRRSDRNRAPPDRYVPGT